MLMICPRKECCSCMLSIKPYPKEYYTKLYIDCPDGIPYTQPASVLSDEEMELDWTDEDGYKTNHIKMFISTLSGILTAQDAKTRAVVASEYEAKIATLEARDKARIATINELNKARQVVASEIIQVVQDVCYLYRMDFLKKYPDYPEKYITQRGFADYLKAKYQSNKGGK